MARRGRRLPVNPLALRNATLKFRKVVKDFARTLPAETLPAFYSKLGLEVLRSVVLLTPVDTGRARGNWQVTLGEPATSQVEDWQSDPVTRGQAVLDGVNASLPVIWITNNVKYIGYLERGSSKQAPAGMVAVALGNLSGVFKR